MNPRQHAVVAEWLRRLTRNQFRSAGVGSNPTDRESFAEWQLNSANLLMTWVSTLHSVREHRWFSGRMLACHAGGPGSIPGRCNQFCKQTHQDQGFMLLIKSTEKLLCPLQTVADQREAKTFGDGGYRSPYLSHAKRALYHLSYVPRTVPCGTGLGVVHPKLKVILGELGVAFSVDLSPPAIHNPR